jgi:hypothetical protein
LAYAENSSKNAISRLRPIDTGEKGELGYGDFWKETAISLRARGSVVNSTRVK